MFRNLLGKLSLQTVFTVPFVTIIVVTVGLTGYLAFRNGQSAVNDLASQLNREVTARIQQHLDTYLATPHLINQLNLDSIRLGQVDVRDLDGMENHLLAQLERFDTIIALGYGSEAKDYVGPVRNYRGFDLGAGFSAASTQYTLEGFGIDSQGHRLELMASDPNYDPRARPWYEAAVQAGKETWVPIYMWSSGDVGLDAVTPVYDKDRKLQGVLDSSLTLNGIGDFLHNTNISQHGQMFIMERSGMLIASSTLQTPYTRSGDALNRISALDSTDPVVQSAARSLTQQFGTLTKINQSQQFYFDLAGAPQLTQVTPYSDQYGLDWLIVTVIPESDFMAQIDANNRNTLLVIAGALLAALILTTWMTRWVTYPISRLNQSAKLLAQGDWNQKVETNRSDEVGELGSSFNRMAENLQASYTSLQMSEEKYRALFENALEGIFQSTPEGKILNVNLALARMYGYESPAAMIASIGSVGDELYVDHSRRAAFQSILVENDRVGDFEAAHYRKDRNIIWVSTNARVVRDAVGKIVFYEGFVTDITERKRAGEAEAEMEALRKLDKLRTALVANVSHELRTPLGLIKLFGTNLLREDVHFTEGEQREFLTQIDKETDKLEAIVNNLLDLSRIQNDQLKLDMHPTDLTLLIRDVITSIEAQDNRHIFVQNLERIPLVSVDPRRIEQVVRNLVTNAIKYSPNGGTITLRCVQEGQQILIQVSDQGIGITPSDLERVFERFYRVDNEVTRRVGGVGLGLSISAGITEAHRGHIWVESTLNEGSTFSFTLPLDLGESQG